MKKIIIIFAAFAAFFCAPVLAAEGGEKSRVGAGLHGGTLGLGVNAVYDFNDTFSARALYNQFDFDYDETESGNEFKGDLELQSFGLLLDWHPFKNGFRLSGGAFYNGTELSARATDDELDINGTDYDGQINANLEFDNFAPYLGVGWSGGRQESGLSFSIDAGALYQNTPQLSARGMVSDNSGNTCNFSVSDNSNATLTGAACTGNTLFTALQTDLENEHRDLANDLDFKWYPVVFLGLTYRF